MHTFKLKTVAILSLLICAKQLQAEGFRKGTIYVQPMIVDSADDNESATQRIRNDIIFMKRIFSQMGITAEALPTKTIGFKLATQKHPNEDARLLNEKWLDKMLDVLCLPPVEKEGVTAVPIFYLPSIVPRHFSGAADMDKASRGRTTVDHGSFVSLWMPPDDSGKPRIFLDTAAHEVLHFLLGADYSFGDDQYTYNNSGFFSEPHHSKVQNDLMAPGNVRNPPRNLEECAPLGRKCQIRNTKIFKNGQTKKLFDVVFENTKYVKVEHCEECSVSLDSGRILYQYPGWLPEPETLIKFYREDLSANGRISIKTDKDNQAKSRSKSTLPIVLRYTDLGQETQNSGGGVLGARIQTKEPVVFNEPISELSANITIEDMTNFSDSQAEGVIVLNANISPSIFSKTHPLEKSAIDRTARALQNNGRHELEITFSDLRLALPETLKDFSIVASGRGVSKEGIEYEVFPDPASGPDRMAIKLIIKQQVGTNKPDLGKLSLRINSKFLLTKGAIPSGQLLDLFKAWYSK